MGRHRYGAVMLAVAVALAAYGCSSDEQGDGPASGGNSGHGGTGAGNTAGAGAGASGSPQSSNGGGAGSDGGASGIGGVGAASGAGGEAGSGQIAIDYYVDPTQGDDDNAGTREQPLRTLARAATLAKSGATIWLLDGVYEEAALATPSNLPCGHESGITVPAGVRLRAVNRLGAQLRVSGTHGLCVTDAEIRDLDIRACGVIRRAIESGSGTLNLIDNDITQCTSQTESCQVQGEYRTALKLSGSARVNMIASRADAATASVACTLATLNDQARLAIVRANVTSTVPLEHPLLLVRGEAELHLQGATLEHASRDGDAIRIDRAARVDILDGTKISNFTAGVMLGGNVAVALTVRDSTFETNDFGITSVMIRESDLSIDVARTTFRGGSAAIKLEGLEDVPITLDDVVAEDHAWWTLYFAGTTYLNLNNVRVSGGELGLRAVLLARYGLATASLRVRNSRFTGNLLGGIFVYRTGPDQVVDLGTAQSPGNNVISGNNVGQATATNLELESSGGLVTAVGNTWDPGVQGADAQGHYSLPAGTTALDVQTGSGRNYSVNGATLRLAGGAATAP